MIEVLNDRYWDDPNTETKIKKQELLNEIQRNRNIIKSCEVLIESYQKQLYEIIRGNS